MMLAGHGEGSAFQIETIEAIHKPSLEGRKEWAQEANRDGND